MTRVAHPYEPKIVTHYRPELSPKQAKSFSKSPTKPRRFMDFVPRNTPLAPYLELFEDFFKVTPEQLRTAHHAEYVQAFLEGRPIVSTERAYARAYQPNVSGIDWSPEFRDSVMWTNGSLISAHRAAIIDPGKLHLSPTSGFHHARPEGGDGFCTFSGQVIAALEIYSQHGKRCAWIDLDGHFGNSIDDTAEDWNPTVRNAIPYNINPHGWHDRYLTSLVQQLDLLRKDIAASNTIDYVCVALGADNHEWDSLAGDGQLTTEEWVEAVDLVFGFVRDTSIMRIAAGQQPLPVVLALFGGYRDDHPESVLGLHAMGLARALYRCAGARELADWRADVRPR